MFTLLGCHMSTIWHLLPTFNVIFSDRKMADFTVMYFDPILGMLMGAMMMGGPRWGYGFGGGWGYGGWGYYDFGPDIHVHNHYDVDNTNIEKQHIQ